MLSRLMSHDDARGIYHATNGGMCAWQEYAQHAIDCCIAEGIPVKARKVGAVPLASMEKFIARRPVHTTLSTARYSDLTGHTPRHWRDAVADYVRMHVAGQ
jgi:dTDP-4-dehydrorhamnose reductase